MRSIDSGGTLSNENNFGRMAKSKLYIFFNLRYKSFVKITRYLITQVILERPGKGKPIDSGKNRVYFSLLDQV